MTDVHHFLDNKDLTREEILDILETVRLLKDAYRQGCTPPLLKGARLAMIFEEPSTRTRVSFENAMTDLGGHALYLKPGEIHFGSHEAIQDTARVLSSMCDGIMLRTVEQSTVETLATYSAVPVFNAMTYYVHPTQGLADVFTMLEHMPPGKTRLEELNVTFVGDSSAVGIMSMEHGHLLSKLGVNYTVASPPEYSLIPDEIDLIERQMAVSGGTFVLTDDVDAAVREADFIIPDVWWYYGYDDEAEKAKRLATFMPRYQLNMEMLGKAPDHCKAMHCLPAFRDYEITSEVLDHPTRSVVFQEAENRLHVQRGLLAHYIYPRLNRPSEAQKAHHDGLIRAFLDSPRGTTTERN